MQRVGVLSLVLIAIMINFQVRTSSECSPTEKGIPSTVGWSDEEGSCKPNVCGGANMIDIHGILLEKDAVWKSSEFPARDINNNYWYDTRRTTACLKGKLITILGDSTMSEMMSELIVLLSGYSSRNESSALDMFRLSKTPGLHVIDGFIGANNISYPGITIDISDGTRPKRWTGEMVGMGTRNMSVSVPSFGTIIHHRYIGHAVLSDNFGGIASIMENHNVRDEFECLYGLPSSGCRKPDILIVQSSFHEAAYGRVDRFAKNIDEFMGLLARIRDAGTRVYWRGSWNYTSEALHPKEAKNNNEWLTQVNCLAEIAAKRYNIPFINLMDPFLKASRYVDGNTITAPFFLPHIGIIAELPFNGLLSALMAQEILRAVCT